jgi:hypothetical protein
VVFEPLKVKKNLILKIIIFFLIFAVFKNYKKIEATNIFFEQKYNQKIHCFIVEINVCLFFYFYFFFQFNM